MGGNNPGGGARLRWRDRKQLLRRDALHKQGFGNLVLARSLLRAVLPAWLVERIDWETLTLEPTVFASYMEGERTLTNLTVMRRCDK